MPHKNYRVLRTKATPRTKKMFNLREIVKEAQRLRKVEQLSLSASMKKAWATKRK